MATSGILSLLFPLTVVAFSPSRFPSFVHHPMMKRVKICDASKIHMKKGVDVEEYKIGSTPAGSVLPAPTGEKCLRLNPKLLPRGELPSRIGARYFPNPHGVDLGYPGMRVIHVDPLVITIEKFLTSDQCDRLLSLHQVRDPAPSMTFGGAFTAAERTSTTWHLYYSEVEELLKKACAVLRCAPETTPCFPSKSIP